MSMTNASPVQERAPVSELKDDKGVGAEGEEGDGGEKTPTLKS